MEDLAPFMREMQITDVETAVHAWNLRQAALAADEDELMPDGKPEDVQVFFLL